MRIRVLMPENGLFSLGTQNDLWTWLHRQFGAANVANTAHRAWLGDAMSIHFRCIENALTFKERFAKLVLADDTMSKLYSSPHVTRPSFAFRDAVGLGFVQDVDLAAALRLLVQEVRDQNKLGDDPISHVALGNILQKAPLVAHDPPDRIQVAAALTLAASTGIALALVWSSVPPMAEEANIAPSSVAGMLYQAVGLGQMLSPVVAGTIVRAGVGADQTGSDR